MTTLGVMLRLVESFTVIIFKYYRSQDRLFVLGNSFHPSLIFLLNSKNKLECFFSLGWLFLPSFQVRQGAYPSEELSALL